MTFPVIPFGPQEAIVTLVPSVQPLNNRLTKFDIYLHIEEEHTAAIQTNEDLSTADIYLSVTDDTGEEVFYKTIEELITRTTSSISITVTEVLTDQHKRLTYAFRNTSDKKVRQKGRIIVDYASVHTP